MNFEEQLGELKRGCVEVLIEDELKKKLRENRPLRIKAGFDPTAPDLHLGHTVLMQKMRQFQELGHEVIFLIGDFTSLIGDPTGRNIMRKPLTEAEIQTNMHTYQTQVFKILDPNRTRVMLNSQWLKNLNAGNMIQLAAQTTVARLIEREDFHQRYTQQQPIGLHEFLYPLLQGYDSVALQADIELGGIDQKFNLLMGRELQKHYAQTPQVVMMMPLLEGLDGIKKMSKSLGNYIGVTDTADEMYGKLMSVSDTLMWRYFELLSTKSQAEIQKLKMDVSQGINPRDIKMTLAHELVARFHTNLAADQAQMQFIERFSFGALPENLPEISITTHADGCLEIGYLLKEAGLVTSTSEALRKIKAGAVRINNERITDHKLKLQAGTSQIYQVGKRNMAKVKLVK